MTRVPEVIFRRISEPPRWVIASHGVPGRNAAAQGSSNRPRSLMANRPGVCPADGCEDDVGVVDPAPLALLVCPPPLALLDCPAPLDSSVDVGRATEVTFGVAGSLLRVHPATAAAPRPAIRARREKALVGQAGAGRGPDMRQLYVWVLNANSERGLTKA